MGDDKLSIKINLADRYYPLKIETKDEERIRRAAKLINEKILQYKQRYVDKDNQDFLAMAALQFVIKYLEEEEKTYQAPVRESLEELNEELEAFLNSKQ